MEVTMASRRLSRAMMLRSFVALLLLTASYDAEAQSAEETAIFLLTGGGQVSKEGDFFVQKSNETWHDTKTYHTVYKILPLGDCSYRLFDLRYLTDASGKVDVVRRPNALSDPLAEIIYRMQELNFHKLIDASATIGRHGRRGLAQLRFIDAVEAEAHLEPEAISDNRMVKFDRSEFGASRPIDTIYVGYPSGGQNDVRIPNAVQYLQDKFCRKSAF